jgi:hypothetical protein
VDCKQVIRRLSFHNAAKIAETARGGNGLISDKEREKLQVGIDTGRDQILLRLSELQYASLAHTEQKNR